MARPVVRIGDINSGGGKAVTPVSNVTANGRPFARFTSVVTPHPPCPLPPIHCVARAAFPASRRVTAGGTPVLRIGDIDTCGHSRATGSMNVTAG